MNQRTHKIGIIGAGKVGLSLALLCARKGHSVCVATRRVKAVGSALATRDAHLEVSDDLPRVARESTILILAVSDTHIRDTCTELTPHLSAGSVVTHLAGALDSSVLEGAREVGACIASTHPLNTFPTLDTAISLLSNDAHGTAVFCEGDAPALAILRPLFESLGFRYYAIASHSKVLYHAACVMACNYFTTVIDASGEIAAQAGLDAETFKQALMPILNATLHNMQQVGTLDALSGPIVRGDAPTVAAHINALRSTPVEPDFTDLYAELARHAVRMADKTGAIKATQIAAITAALTTS